MKYIIVIPSFRRADILLTHTLACLQRTDIKADIYVFTADEQDTKLYRAKLPKHIKVVQGVRGIPNQRNFIQRYFPEGERLVFIDDDLKDIIGLTAAGKRTKATRMHAFLQRAFELTELYEMRMFGINSTNSNLEMKHTISAGRIYLVGNFYGLINTHSILVDEGQHIKTRRNFKAGKESHERALLMNALHGGVLKFRAYGVVSKYWGVPGGHQVSRTAEGEEEAARWLHAKYPDITALRFYKDVWDLVIKPKTTVLRGYYPQPDK